MVQNQLSRALTLVVALSLALPAVWVQAAGKAKPAIQKCQDPTGRWHYGDSAAAECAKSKITVMSEKGMTKDVIAAPLTEQELREREANQEAEDAAQKKTQEQARKDALLLATYGVEDDITYVRDRKIAQVEATIKASEQTLKPLRAALARMEAQAADESKSGKTDETTLKNIEQTKAQIARHEAAMADKHKEQEAIRAEYDLDLARYRELKKHAPIKTPAAAAKK